MYCVLCCGVYCVVVVVSVAGCGPASAVAARAPAADFVSAFALAPVAAVVAEPVVAVGSGPVLIFAARVPAAAGLVSAFVLAPEPAVASDLAPIFFEHLPAVVFAAAFVLAASHADRFFALFDLPAVRAAHRPLC